MSAIGSLLLSSFVPLVCSLLLHSSVFSLLAASVFVRPSRLFTASAFVRLLTARCFCLRPSSSFAHCFCLTTYVWPSLVGRHTGRLTSFLFARYCFTYLISFSSARSHAPVTRFLSSSRIDQSVVLPLLTTSLMAADGALVQTSARSRAATTYSTTVGPAAPLPPHHAALDTSPAISS